MFLFALARFLLIALNLIALTVLATGLAVVVWGIVKRSKPLKWIGAGLAGVCLVLMGGEFACFQIMNEALEWNPSIANDEQVLGLWADAQESVDLFTDHIFFYQSPSTRVTGTWSRYDWNLYLRKEDWQLDMRFVKFLGRLELLTHPSDHQDDW